MLPRNLLGTALIPDTNVQLQLYQSGELFSIKIPGRGDLMNSRVHGSEKALAELACENLGHNANPRLLIGGLGMGFTTAAALKILGPAAEVVTAELVPEVVTWNRTLLGAVAGNPLDDERSRVFVGDVADLIRKEPAGFDAILMAPHTHAATHLKAAQIGQQVNLEADLLAKYVEKLLPS